MNKGDPLILLHLGFAQETLKTSFIQVGISFHISVVTLAEGRLQEQIKEYSMGSNRDNQCLKAVVGGRGSSGLIGLSFLGKEI